MLNNIKIRVKLLLSFGILILFMVGIITFGCMQIKQINQNTVEVYQKHIHPLETLEQVKTGFNALRTNARIVMTYGMVKDWQKTTETIDHMYAQYEVLKNSANAHIERMSQANTPQLEIDDFSSMFTRITDKYWPGVERMFDAALAADFEGINAEVADMGVLAAEIETYMSDIFDDKMAAATHQTEMAVESTQQTMMTLLLTGVAMAAISLLLALYMGGSLSKRIESIRKTAQDIAEGRLITNDNTDEKDEIGDLSRDLSFISEIVGRVSVDIQKMTDAFIGGDISQKIDIDVYDGAYKAIAININALVKTLLDDILGFLALMRQFADGDFNVKMERLPGKKRVMNDTLDQLQGTLTNIILDTEKMVGSATAGCLDDQADASKYKGDWVRIMEGLNHVMAAVSKPISEAKSILTRVAMGDFSQQITGDYQGAFLQIKISVNEMVTNIEGYISEIGQIVKLLADNDLTPYIKREYVGRFGEIKDALNQIFDRLNNVIADIRNSSEQVASGARMISENSISLANGATEQASAAEELNATIQIINENTRKNSRDAKRAEELANNAKTNAEKGNTEMNHMLSAMEGIKASSDSIAKIIKVIDNIAFQTNILALNAAVEAARAGAHGRGFGVVADEVRNLAAHSQQAAKETTNLIEESVKRVNDGIKMADMTAVALQKIVSDAETVASLIGNIAVASDEQASAVSQVTDGLMQITEVIQTNSTTSEEAASASEELSSQSIVLQKMVGKFTLRELP